MSNTPAPQQPPPVSATVHIYRGMLDRASTWRVRIDAPSNWAVITSGTAVGFVLSSPTHSHAVLLLVMTFMLSFLIIEARRLRYYDLWSSWVRLLETEYFAPILRNKTVSINETWQQIMLSDMAYPHFKTPSHLLIGWRLRDNYLALYTFLLLSWLLKLLIHPRPDLPPMTTDTFVNHATIGLVPGWLIVGGVLLGYTTLVVYALATIHRREPSTEVLGAERILQKMASPAQQPVNRTKWAPSMLDLEYPDSYDRNTLD